MQTTVHTRKSALDFSQKFNGHSSRGHTEPSIPSGTTFSPKITLKVYFWRILYCLETPLHSEIQRKFMFSFTENDGNITLIFLLNYIQIPESGRVIQINITFDTKSEIYCSQDQMVPKIKQPFTKP